MREWILLEDDSILFFSFVNPYERDISSELGPIPLLSTSESRTGVLIPLYTYPGESWSEVRAMKRAHPKVPILVVINPDNGPGTRLDRKYAAETSTLRL